MNKLFFISILVLAITSCSNPNHAVVEKAFHVYGNCEQCKARIEQAAKLNGVTEIDWHVDSKLLTCKMDTLLTSSEVLLRAISKAGHDNEMFPANDYSYNKLPECCQYERMEH